MLINTLLNQFHPHLNPSQQAGRSVKNVIGLLFLSFLLSACSAENHSQDEATVTLSPKLTQLFMQSCANCHTKPNTGAPLAGDRQAWQPILAKGLEKTLERTINGYAGMPPGGLCFECTPEDLEQLILFMAQLPTNNKASSMPGSDS